MPSTEEQKDEAVKKAVKHVMDLAEEANGAPLTQKPQLLVPPKKRPRKK